MIEKQIPRSQLAATSRSSKRATDKATTTRAEQPSSVRSEARHAVAVAKAANKRDPGISQDQADDKPTGVRPRLLTRNGLSQSGLRGETGTVE